MVGLLKSKEEPKKKLERVIQRRFEVMAAPQRCCNVEQIVKDAAGAKFSVDDEMEEMVCELAVVETKL